MIHCPHCDNDLPPSSFYKHSGRKNGASILCKSCYKEYEASPERRAKRTWNTLHCRVRMQSSYDGIEIRMTRKEFLCWAIPQYQAWMNANPDDCPSLDRKDPKAHYQIGNLRILERGENSRLASNHPNVFAPLGMAWCGTHKAYLPVQNFQRCQSNFNGLQQRCAECQNKATQRLGSKSRRVQKAANQEAMDHPL